MKHEYKLDIKAEESGLSEPLAKQLTLLGTLLEQAIRDQAGPKMLNLMGKLHQLCGQVDTQDNATLCEGAYTQIQKLSRDQIVWLLHAYTSFFHLANQAEQQEIIRINWERVRQSRIDKPRPESIDEAIHHLQKQGYAREQVLQLLGQLDIQPTLTAHPTEARRRSILFKQQRISGLLAGLNQYSSTTPPETEQILDDLYNQIALLLATDEVRAERPTVKQEIHQGLYFMRIAIWEVAVQIYRDTQRALQQYYGEAPDFPPFLHYRSWIGGDRDGNPHVTPEITRWTIITHRETALRRYCTELQELYHELSLSKRQVGIPPALYRSLEQDARETTLGHKFSEQLQREPYRLKISYMMARLGKLLKPPNQTETGENTYNSKRFIEDLQLLKRCLEESGFGKISRHGRLGRLLILTQTFGFHLAALDVRQHSHIHEKAVAALLQIAGITRDYLALSEKERLAVLSAQLQKPHPLRVPNSVLPESTQQVLETFAVIRDAIAQEPEAIGSYVISMTHTVSDLLEVMLLAKEAQLWQLQDGKVICPLDFVPLFETIEDLEAADKRMLALIKHPIYRQQIAARGHFQEIMLGYSDSSKDGGYWMANWALHKAQKRLGKLCHQQKIDFRLFHGRGGTVGRGGGRTSQTAILAMPPAVHNGRIRFTEQGEVISFRYALPAMARRHTEQIVNAMIQATAVAAQSGDKPSDDSYHEDLMERIAQQAMGAYRTLIEQDGFWSWYTQVTPIEHISNLPIASRPISRTSATEVDFKNLRAIPWVFAWTQTRYLVPGWFGLGQALQKIMGDETLQETLQQMYQQWPFFNTVIDDAQREMARARLKTASHYARLANQNETRFHDIIVADFEKARKIILEMSGQQELLDNTPTIQKTIIFRNPYTDVLNLLQIELMKRYRQAPENEKGLLRQALFLSLNGIAAAMQSTG